MIKSNNSQYSTSLLILLGFVLYFAYDIYTLKKFLSHPDIFTYYYPFRQWFSERLFNGEFPLWNPYWGIGHPAEVWATFPLDIYTILEIIFGPKYHYFQTIQLALILLACFYSFVKLGFKPIVAATGSLLFFMTPWVTYFYFYFLLGHSFIANILLFLFVYQWFKTEDYKYIFFIIWTTIFSMFGTKPEFWFYQTSFYIFISFATGLVFYSGKLSHFSKMFSLAILAMVIGVFAHTWQLNILIRIMGSADRAGEHSLNNLFVWEMYHNLLKSISESELLKMLGVGFLFYLSIILKKRFSWLFLLSGAVAFVVLKIWTLPVIISFIKSPVLIGAVIGIISTQFSYKNKDWKWQNHIQTFLLFSLLIYYWCRPERGDLREMEVIRSAPVAFKILVSFLVWIGCTQFWKNKLAKLAYFSILFMFLMRDQGQIILAYLTGLLWIPTRDNYIIDFAVAVLAVIGLSRLELPNIFTENNKWIRRWNIMFTIPIVTIIVIVWSTSHNLYYTHRMMEDTPPDYPYYTGVTKVREVIKELRDYPTARIYLVNDHYSKGATYGFGETLLEGIGQVTNYSSLLPKNYKDWTIYKKLGIRPEQRWGGFTGELSEKTISKLPKRNTLGYDYGTIFFYSVRAIPLTKKNELRLLGVQHVVKMFPTFGNEAWSQSKDITQEIEGLDLKNVKIKNGLLAGELNNPLPRAFLMHNVTDTKLHEFKNEMAPIVDDNNNFIKTKSYKFPLSSAKIEKYEPENVSIRVDTKEESYLVISDLYHPFWHARIDGKEIEIIPAFYIFRAVKVPQGKHVIDFYCNVTYFKASMVISLSAVFLSVLAAISYFKFNNRCCKKDEML